MKLSVVSAAVVSIIAGGTIPAFAQTPLPTPPLTQPRPATSPPDPKAVPGFLDPATGKFTPLAPKAARTIATHEGTIHFITTFVLFDEAFSIGDTIFCTYKVEFGFIETAAGSASSFFVPVQNIFARINFGVKNGRTENVKVPFKFAANPPSSQSGQSSSPEPEIQIQIECIGTDDSGFGHTYTFVGPPGVLGDGIIIENEKLDF